MHNHVLHHPSYELRLVAQYPERKRHTTRNKSVCVSLVVWRCNT